MNNQRLTLRHLSIINHLPKTMAVDLNHCDEIEARQARLYFRHLFGPSFARRDNNPINSLLNYGYAILLSEIAQDVVSLGYHPALGIHHYSQSNPLNLASDLMEPFRPIVDCLVKRKKMRELTAETKKELVSLMDGVFHYRHQKRRLEEILSMYVKKCLDFMSNDSDCLPEFVL